MCIIIYHMIKLIRLRTHQKRITNAEVYKRRQLIMYNVVQVYRIACYPIFITGIENIVNPQFCCTVTVLQSCCTLTVLQSWNFKSLKFQEGLLHSFVVYNLIGPETTFRKTVLFLHIIFNASIVLNSLQRNITTNHIITR